MTSEMAAGGTDDELTKALQGLIKSKEFFFDHADTLRKWCRSRFTTDRWLDENEREWYAMDRLCRSRPWATNKDKAFKYPFRDATNAMRKVEGKWVGDDEPTPPDTRGEASCDVIEQVNCIPMFPPDHRVLLFTPEFGSHASFDMESWSYIEPQEKVDLWVVSWQGWTEWDAMIVQVTRRVLSFADGVNTVWFGQGAGALVAYEVLKRIERGVQTPNLPVGLVVADCPAPHEFAGKYEPSKLDGWKDLLHRPDVTDERRKLVDADLRTMASYVFKRESDRGVAIPITAMYHADDKLASADAVQAWEAYSREGKFEAVDLGDAEEMDEYVQGTRYVMTADPTALSSISEMCQKFCRWNEPMPDIGDVNGPLPDSVDCVVIGAGICGINQAHYSAMEGHDVLCLERYHEIGGVWRYYGNEYSKVNTSEIGYRILEKEGFYQRVNEDHTPRCDILRDIYTVAAKCCKDRIRCNIDVVGVEKTPTGEWLVKTRHMKTGAEKTIAAKGVTIHVNRRIGKARKVDWEGREHFRGETYYGYGNEVKDVKFWGKTVLIVGAGAFAFENIRTAVEHGAKHVTLLGRRDGTTCPKWVDMLAFLRPLDQNLNTHKSGNMISFECWQNCYSDAGLRPPKCWQEGLLKPNNHTISVSDLAYIGGYHGLVDLQMGEIKCFRPDGLGVELQDGSTIDCEIIIKATGFHLNDEVQKLTGMSKMQPYCLMDFNLQYSAEPLLDGGQFGSAKDRTETNLDFSGITEADVAKGKEVLKELGIKAQLVEPHGNPFGSGNGGMVVFQAKLFAWLMSHPEEQKALLAKSGAPPQDVVELWASQQGEYHQLIILRVLSAIGKRAREGK